MTEMQALYLLDKAEGKPGQVWHPIGVKTVEIPQAKDGELLVKITAAAYNHRDIFIRQSLYPTIQFNAVMGADGVGTVDGKPVVINPTINWKSDPDGPNEDDGYAQGVGILGSMRAAGTRGTFAEYIVVPEEDVADCPPHFYDGSDKLGLAQAAALPLAGLTAYRATIVKGEVKQGQNVLITGIGGGVALLAMQFAIAAGAKVWVTSGSAEKIAKAKELGAEGGVSYKDEDWPKQLAAMLPKSRPKLDAIVDSAGGPIITQCIRILKHGARVVCFGQTTGKPIEVTMAAVLQNIELRTSTMGSRREFFDMVAFTKQHKIRPVVDTVLNGLDKAEEGFQRMLKGSQFGKIVIVPTGSLPPKL